MNKKVYLICSVRNCDEKTNRINSDYVAKLESDGYEVHYPPRDVDQNCDTGISIVTQHRDAMEKCDEVHIIWDVESKGSHFDLGMAIAMKKPLVPVMSTHADTGGKSYWKVMNRIYETKS